jgi:hypothetical protein
MKTDDQKMDDQKTEDQMTDDSLMTDDGKHPEEISWLENDNSLKFFTIEEILRRGVYQMSHLKVENI